jgi:UDP-N-acetylglucosamine--N-acetylmuramyl-(pentapeptide) pyrophosphoryl-undecaprenol N-acetylglucosamine transferase
VTDNHQFLNAKHLSDMDAAWLIEEKDLSTDRLINMINELKIDKNVRKNRAKIMQGLSTPEAAKDIVQTLKKLKNSTI